MFRLLLPPDRHTLKRYHFASLVAFCSLFHPNVHLRGSHVPPKYHLLRLADHDGHVLLYRTDRGGLLEYIGPLDLATELESVSTSTF